MFPLQPTDELALENPNYCQPDEDKFWDDLIVETDIFNFSSQNNSILQLGKQQQFGIEQGQGTRSRDVCCSKNSAGNDHKRVWHREIERKRRQEMSNLHASLRDFLPFECIKGKRSMSDHMQEAVTYIKCTEKNIEELKARRDKLKKLSNYSTPCSKIGCSENNSNDSPNFVTVNTLRDNNGVEILIQTSANFKISRVLAQLLGSDINVISCFSTKINGVFLHKIHAEEFEQKKSLDAAVLAESLRKVIDD